MSSPASERFFTFIIDIQYLCVFKKKNIIQAGVDVRFQSPMRVGKKIASGHKLLVTVNLVLLLSRYCLRRPCWHSTAVKPHLTEFWMLFFSELCVIFRSGTASAHFQTWRSPRKASRCYGTPPSLSPTSHCCLSAPTQTPWREQLGLCRI